MEHWQEVSFDCDIIIPASKITFMDSTKSDFDRNPDVAKASFNPKRQIKGRSVSPCYQCVLFYFPSLTDDSEIRGKYSTLELWSHGQKLFFFRKPNH
jgi:hypothetical protein